GATKRYLFIKLRSVVPMFSRTNLTLYHPVRSSPACATTQDLAPMKMLRHDELAAALFRRGVPQDRFHFRDRIGQHRVGLHALLGAREQAALDIGQRRGEFTGERRLVGGVLR